MTKQIERLRSAVGFAAALICFLMVAACNDAMAQSGVRTLNATGQGTDVIVTDCANCGDDIGMVIECKGKTARIEVPWAAAKDGIEGAAAPVTVMILGKSYSYPAKTLRSDAIGYLPAFSIKPGDPLLTAMQSAPQAEVRFQDVVTTISLSNAPSAIDTFVTNCWGASHAASLASQQQKLSDQTGVLNAPTTPPKWCVAGDKLTPTETTICDNSSLWLLDNQLNETYQEAVGEFDYLQRKFGVQGQAAKLRTDQADWLKSKRSACQQDTSCLTSAYLKRIEDVRPRGD